MLVNTTHNLTKMKGTLRMSCVFGYPSHSALATNIFNCFIL